MILVRVSGEQVVGLYFIVVEQIHVCVFCAKEVCQRGVPAAPLPAELCIWQEAAPLPLNLSHRLPPTMPALLAPLLLPLPAAVAHAWVHDQCARWSPEVYDPE